jgi:hypothetical protein
MEKACISGNLGRDPYGVVNIFLVPLTTGSIFMTLAVPAKVAECTAASDVCPPRLVSLAARRGADRSPRATASETSWQRRFRGHHDGLMTLRVSLVRPLCSLSEASIPAIA